MLPDGIWIYIKWYRVLKMITMILKALVGFLILLKAECQTCFWFTDNLLSQKVEEAMGGTHVLA